MLGVIPGKACAICRSSRYFTASLCTGESYLKFGLNMQLKSIVVECSSLDKVVGVWHLFIHLFFQFVGSWDERKTHNHDFL